MLRRPTTMNMKEGDAMVHPGAAPSIHLDRSRSEPRKLGGSRPSRLWRIRGDIPRWLTIVLGVLSFVVPVALWYGLRITDATNEIYLPWPQDVVTAGWEMASSGQLWSDTWASSRRIGIGFAISLLISVPLGLSMGTFRTVNGLFEPIISFIRYMPATAFVYLLLTWMGIDEGPKVTLIVIGTVFFNTLMIANTVWHVPAELVRVASTLGAGNLSVFRKVIFPYALPGVIDAARVNIAAAWNLIVVTEVVAAQEGLGRRIVSAQKFLETDEIFAILIVIGVIGLVTDFALRTLRNRLAPWSQEKA
jgi:NitT/TauT family transport system permease protein